MKFLVNHRDFKKALQQVSQFAGTGTIPFTADVFIGKKNDHQVDLICADMETIGSVVMDVADLESEEDCTAFSLNVKALKKILPAIKVGETGNVLIETIKIDRSADELSIMGAHGNVWIRLSDSDVTEAMRSYLYSGIEKFDNVTPILTGGLFWALKSVLFCASADEARPVLQCVKIGKALAATDGFRIVKNPISYDLLDCLVEAKTLEKAGKLLGSEVTVKFNPTSHTIQFSDDRAMVITWVVDGNFPNYEAIIPKTWWMKCTVDRLQLIEALNLSLTTHKTFGGNNVVRFTFHEGLVILSSIVEGEGTCTSSLFASPKVASKEVEPESKMELPFKIAANARMLKEIVEHVRGEQVVLKFHANNTPIVIQTADDLMPNPVYVLMPMHLG